MVFARRVLRPAIPRAAPLARSWCAPVAMHIRRFTSQAGTLYIIFGVDFFSTTSVNVFSTTSVNDPNFTC